MGPVFVAPIELLIFCDLMPSRSGTVPCCVLHPVIITLLWSLLFEVSHFLGGEKKSGHNMNLRYIIIFQDILIDILKGGCIQNHSIRLKQSWCLIFQWLGKRIKKKVSQFVYIVADVLSLCKKSYILLLMVYECDFSHLLLPYELY